MSHHFLNNLNLFQESLSFTLGKSKRSGTSCPLVVNVIMSLVLMTSFMGYLGLRCDEVLRRNNSEYKKFEVFKSNRQMRELRLNLTEHSDSFNIMINTLNGVDLLNNDFVQLEAFTRYQYNERLEKKDMKLKYCDEQDIEKFNFGRNTTVTNNSVCLDR